MIDQKLTMSMRSGAKAQNNTVFSSFGDELANSVWTISRRIAKAPACSSALAELMIFLADLAALPCTL